MRLFPHFVLACVLCSIALASAWAQQIQCIPCEHGFGKVQIGSDRTLSFHLTNTGTKTLRITSVTLQGGPFTSGPFSLPVSVKAGANIDLPVIFTPTAVRWIDGTISVNSNAPGSPLNMHVAGTGIAVNNPVLGISPASLNFGNVNVGSSSSLQATLTASNAAVTISSDRSNSSEFAILGLTLPVTIQAGSSIPVTIQFSPNASGTASAKAGFISNAIDSPALEQLTGTGVAQQSHSVDLSWTPGSGSPVGYNVYRGTAEGGPYAMINTALDSSASYTDDTVGSGDTYYYVATEVNAQGQESAYSNVAKAVVPNP